MLCAKGICSCFIIVDDPAGVHHVRLAVDILFCLQVCTVFAQLTVNGKWEGPHVFVVRIRDDQGKLTHGVRIRDNGPKMGLNGVDNGQIWFEHVRIPRDALLNRFADVAEDGTYSSPFPTVGQRFGVTVGGLTTGEESSMTSDCCCLNINEQQLMRVPSGPHQLLGDWQCCRLRPLICLMTFVQPSLECSDSVTSS